MAISAQDYQLKVGESIDQYNARIAGLRAAETTAVTPVSSPTPTTTPTYYTPPTPNTTSLRSYLQTTNKNSTPGAIGQLAGQAGVSGYLGTPEQDAYVLYKLYGITTPALANYKIPSAGTNLLTSQSGMNFINPATGKSNADVLAESTAAAQTAASMIGGTYSQSTGYVANASVTPPSGLAGNTGSATAAENFYTSLSAQLAAQQAAAQTEADKRAADYQVQIDKLNQQMADYKSQSEGALASQGAAAQAELQQKQDLLAEEKKRFDENYNLVQGLAGQLQGLMTTGNQLIAQQKGTTGLSSIMNPRINQTISDVTAQAGVIQAVISVYNGQMNQAQSQLTTASDVITSAYSDQIDYFKTLLNYYSTQETNTGTQILDLTKDQKDYLDFKLASLQQAVANTQATTKMIQDAMLDPDKAMAYAQSGVTLNDSPAQIGQKLAQYGYTKEVSIASYDMAKDGWSYLSAGQNAPANSQVTTITDSKGVTKTWYRPTTGGLTPENKAIAYDEVKRRAAQTFETDRMNNADKMISPDTYERVRNELTQIGLGTYLDDFDKYFSPLLSSESKQRFGVQIAQPSSKDIFQQYKDAGYTRKEVETQWKADNKLDEIPTPIVQSLDEVFVVEKPWYKFW